MSCRFRKEKRNRNLLLKASYWAREWLPISALAVIALPTLIIGLYLAFFASDRYAVEVQFAIRGQEVPVMDVAGIMNAFGGSPSQTASDSYIVSDYVMSRQLVEGSSIRS